MAINERPDDWRNENTLILAASGGGKSQMLRQLPDVPARGARVLIWDPDRDHRGHHYSTRAEFLAAVRAAMQYVKGAPKSRGFRLAYSPGDNTDSVQEFEWFADVVWAVLDGRYRTFIVCEELADTCPHAGKALPNAGRLLRRCRKYGGRFIGVSQRSQEISKTFFSQCDIKYVGKHLKGKQAKQVAEACGLTPVEVPTVDLHFLKLDAGKEPEPLVIKWKPYKRA